MNPDGFVLGIDTCGAESTLALGRIEHGSLQVQREAVLGARMAGTQLTQAMADMLGDVKPAELTAIVAVRGPGSFTGMRIGLSAAKALAEAAEVPLYGVSRLEIMASDAVDVTVALDAGRGRVYVRPRVPSGIGNQDASHDLGQPNELLLEVDELRALLSPEEQAAMLVCEDKVIAQFAHARHVASPTAAQAIAYALRRIQEADADDVATLDALYVWRPEQMLGSPTPGL